MVDERFSALSKDPRYRLPSRKKAQTAVDSRFKRIFTDDGFQKKATVDRYGRKLKNDSAKKAIKQKFRLEDDSNPVAPTSEDEESEEEVQTKARDYAREGFSGSSSEEESSSDEESDEEADLAEDTAGFDEAEEVPMGEVTKRFAVVNLDWDNIRAMDIMAVAQSFAPPGARVVETVIYPSEYGRERMQKEELEGPPREIFASTKKVEAIEEESGDSDEDEKIRKRLLKAQATEGEEFNTAKLRKYQLERLRYYYAVVTCDSETTAKALYDAMDGREYLTTSNFFDLRFIPDGTTFDEEAREECTRLPDGYKPNDFQTEALTHSKVRLTWDDDDTTRKEVQKRAFSRAELNEEDLKAYIGSDSSDADSVTSRKSSAESKKLSKKEAAKAKMRAALGLPDQPTKMTKVDDDEGDMQITFSTALSSKSKKKGVFENEPIEEQNTRETYINKERERRLKRMEKNKADKKAEIPAAVEVDGFDDPFFNDAKASAVIEKQARKAEQEKKRAAKDAEKQAAASRRAELELLMADEGGSAVQHFDMKEIEKAEKLARKKGKKAKKEAAQTVKDDFKVETEDPRFKQLFESHEYAIDPSNPKFKGTSGMQALLEEGRKKRKHVDDDETTQKKPKTASGGTARDSELNSLVARLKTKSR